jgi:hypothetical protein
MSREGESKSNIYRRAERDTEIETEIKIGRDDQREREARKDKQNICP